jgi:thioredoxin-related protein
MKRLLAIASSALVLTVSAFGAAAGYESDFAKAQAAAQAQNKMMFVIYGREACSNCQATKAMIKAHQIKVTDSKFVLVDLNCDDRQVSSDFNKRFGKENFGTTLPFVVVTDSAGNALASSGGYKDAAEWEKILHAAQRKAAASSTGVGGAAKTDWPFKTAAPGTTGTTR